MKYLSLFSLLFSTTLACSGKDKDSGGEDAVDADGDGYLNTVDCDDEDSTISPDAVEVCDGVDNDCDGFVDDADDSVDLSTGITLYTDNDGDGFGGTATQACTLGDGLAENSDDCNDTDAAIRPDADEICNDIDDDCDGLLDDADDSVDASTGSTFYADTDADGYGNIDDAVASCGTPSGYVADSTDCDDTTDAANPGAAEACDSIDNDCDGLTDDADDSLDLATALTSYADSDSDGYGDVALSVQTCVVPSGYVADSTDCDDTATAVNPGAAEVCNSVDDDCDGLADDEDDSLDATTGSTFYADTDADGYGDAADTTQTCVVPTGYVEDATDCDDDESAANPGAAEVCDSIDNDCDGLADDADDSLDATTGSTFYADTDADGYGNATDTAQTCLAPTGYVADSTDCDDDEPAANPGETEVCDEIDNDCDGLADDADDSLDATTGSTFYADDDADGYGDAADTTQTCVVPSGYVTDSTDCDDAAKAVNPGAAEVCNSIDDDCDRLTDDADGGLDTSTGSTFYADDDADGYGDVADTTQACLVPSGYVADSTDCDDTAKAVNPGATEVCNSIDDDCDRLTDDADAGLDASTGTMFYADDDADGYGDAADSVQTCLVPSGYVADSTDCDDGEADANPGAAEVCDSIDNDCDGAVDDADAGLDTTTGSTFYADTDGDGYGDAGNDIDACLVPSGYVVDNTDCDDGEADANPGETEVCDIIDNDCDGLADDEDGSLDTSTGTVFYADDDADGYGDVANMVQTCLVPSGYVADSTDCDDGEADANPGETEVCDVIDNDCDGLVDDEDGSLDTSTGLMFYADADADGFGDVGDTVETCEQPSGYVLDATDCDDTDEAINPDGSEVCDTVDNDCDTLVDDADGSLDTTTGTTFYGDLDEDGYGDADETIEACEQPSGYVEDDADCDDTEPGVNPGETEIPQDGIDQDCDGVDAPFTVTDLAAGDLVITEFQQNPKAVADLAGEWFEIYNNAGGQVDLDGLYVYDLGSDKFTVTGELLVEDGDWVVFGRNGTTSSNGGVTVDYVYGSAMSMGNADDEIYLAESSAKAVVIDGIDYDDGATFPDGDGASSSLHPALFDATDNDDGLHWCESTTLYGSGDYGTPGADNDSCAYNVGNDTALPLTASITADTLLGTRLIISDSVTIDKFGLIAKAGGANVKMALYDDNSGSPGTLIASTTGDTVATGVNEIDIVDIEITAGTYYLMALYDASGAPAYTTTTSSTVWYRTLSYSSSLPTTFGTATTYCCQEFSYYLSVYP